MRKGRIEDWQEISFFSQKRIFGKVYECDAFEEGEEMFTSEVVAYHNTFGSTVVETKSGSMYHLGKKAEKEETFKEIVKRFLVDQSLN